MSEEEGKTRSVEFKVPDEDENTEKKSGKRDASAKSRRSSFFKMVSKSFRRSGGERGADVETLRGNNGADFEARAFIQRGEAGGIGCGCFGSGKESKERLLLIKGPFVFVFKSEDAPAPKYAISLAHLKAKQQKPLTAVTIESNLGEVEYQIKFSEDEVANKFVKIANKQAAIGESDEVRKRLGHQHLLNKRKSVRYAETVAMKKVDDQPEKPEKLSAEDIERFNAGI